MHFYLLSASGCGSGCSAADAARKIKLTQKVKERRSFLNGRVEASWFPAGERRRRRDEGSTRPLATLPFNANHSEGSSVSNLA